MPRASLIAALALACALAALPAGARGRTNPHLDPSLVRSGCPACHAAHGRSKSPMLRAPQKEICLGCHGIAAGALPMGVRSDARPPSIGSIATKRAVHPIDRDAFSRRDPDAVVCTSCHSPHRSNADLRSSAAKGTRVRAPGSPSLFENDLCLGCHGSRSRDDIAGCVDQVNRSYHPLLAPAAGYSQTVDSRLSGKLINCTDCHGNDDPSGPRGPHGSDIPGLLAREYRRSDGLPETANDFALCYACHDREALLGGSSFPHHALHVVEKRIACASCHDAHGVPGHRALVSFARAAVTPSTRSGRIAFVSDAPGSGACHLTCHGADHSPATYGAPAYTELLPEIAPTIARPRERLARPRPDAVAPPRARPRRPPE